jgi:hypothetical protein
MGFGPKPKTKESPEGAEKRSVHAVHEHLRRPRTTDLGALRCLLETFTITQSLYVSLTIGPTTADFNPQLEKHLLAKQ